MVDKGKTDISAGAGTGTGKRQLAQLTLIQLHGGQGKAGFQHQCRYRYEITSTACVDPVSLADKVRTGISTVTGAGTGTGRK